MILTYVRFDSCDWEAWYSDDELLVQGNVVSAFDLALALAQDSGDYGLYDVQRIDNALVDAQTGKAPMFFVDVKKAAR